MKVLRIPHLVEAAAVADALAELLHLGQLVGHALLLVELLGQRLQLGERQLQRQPVGVAAGRVLQHVLGTATPGTLRSRHGSASGASQRVLEDDPRADPKLQPGCQPQSVSLCCCCQKGASPEPPRTSSRTSPVLVQILPKPSPETPKPSPEPPKTFARTSKTHLQNLPKPSPEPHRSLSRTSQNLFQNIPNPCPKPSPEPPQFLSKSFQNLLRSSKNLF